MKPAADDKTRVIAAVEMAAASDVVNLTCDRIEALAGGHGMINLAIFSVANVVTEELIRGQSLEVKFANQRRLPVDDILAKAVEAAKKAGADRANAALLAAAIMYLAGSPAQVGIPAGNRKLGATARILAGADRCGVGAVPTGKMNSKVSGFPAVLALNQAMMEGRLSPVSGWDIPKGVGGGLYGHSALGEDIIWPQVAENGARIGTEAMLAAMAGAGVAPKPFYAAVLGAAAVLEIIHPDADVPEGQGRYGRTSTAYLVGRTAAATAGLPEKLHLRLTGRQYPTAQVIGDLGLILKDIGGPTVVGMMAFAEVMAVFKEQIVGASGGAHNSPLGHMSTYAVAAMMALSQPGADPGELARRLVAERTGGNINPESALVSINTVARKAAELRDGPVTRFLIDATEPARVKAIYDRAAYAYDRLAEGRGLTEVVEDLDKKLVATVERQTAKLFKNTTGEDVSLKFVKIAKGARRTAKPALKYFSFDPRLDIEVTVGGRKVLLEHFTDRLIPQAAQGGGRDLAWAIPYATSAAAELMMAGNNLLNAVIPAAVAAAMKVSSAEEAAAAAEAAALITCGIPGGRAAALKVAGLARDIMAFYDYEY